MLLNKYRIVTLFLLMTVYATGQNMYTYHNHDYDYDVRKAVYSSEVRFHTAWQSWRVGDIEAVVNYDSLIQLNRLQRTFEKKWKQKTWDKVLNDNVITFNREQGWFAVNFLMNWDGGYSKGDSLNPYVNTRGFEVKGEIGKNFSFYTSFYENQGRYVNYLNQNIIETSVVPGQGKVRAFGDSGFDFSSSSAYVAFDAGDHFDFQLGYDKNFVGDGYRSLLMTDNAFNYPFLKINIKFWHINYSVMYAQFMDIRFRISDDLGYQKKWGTFHYLSWAASKRFNIGIFESVIWQSQDSTGYRGFEFGYLSPIIFLRPVEYANGSPDNALIGFNASYIVGKHNVIYGQFIFDEFKLSEIRAGDGWWGNKYGWQLGFKAYDIFKIKNLYFQTEYNRVRPYTFAHKSSIKNYGHYNAALGHPMGANFWESVSFLKYSYKRFYLKYQFQYAMYGVDYDTLNFGKDIYKSYDTRVSDYNNFIGQGRETSVVYNDITLSFLVNPAYNLNIAVGYTNRAYRNDAETILTSFFHIGLRTSLRNFYYDF